jgi:hypothetical protein
MRGLKQHDCDIIAIEIVSNHVGQAAKQGGN